VTADVAQALLGAIGGHDPVLLFLAGSNGAGKSTFHETYLKHLGYAFVNTDEIQKTVQHAAANPSDAQRLAFDKAEEIRRDLLSVRASFCTETVFSDPKGAKLKFLKEARRAGYWIFLVFIGLESKDLSMARVLQRVASGGHDVPEEKVDARFARTLANLRKAVTMVNEAFLYDNSSSSDPFRPVAVYHEGRLVLLGRPVPAWAKGLPGVTA
jgi:predicted ABC-type ATPase